MSNDSSNDKQKSEDQDEGLDPDNLDARAEKAKIFKAIGDTQKEYEAVARSIKANGDGRVKADKNGKQAHFVQKYSEDGLLAEAVIVAGIPYFAVARLRPKSKELALTLESSIPIDDSNEYKPYQQAMYLNKPYIFNSKQDFKACFEKAKSEALSSLYRKVKAIWLRYIDADDFHISICAADTIFSYYQDKIGLTHYLFFVGSPGSGKSNNLLVLKYLAYRNFTSTDMTAANIYQFLGSGEEGQGTLCEDEADRIDEDRQKMSIYKNGYITGFPVARTDTSFGRKQQRYNTFCFKAFAAERFPDSFKAKGFNQRVLELQCSFGDPEEDITEVVNPAGEEEFQTLLDELNETRNLLLMCRLLHFNRSLPDIKLNIKAREKQLFKPIIRIFQDAPILSELLPVVSKYVMQKREANFQTLHAFLYRVIKDIVTDQNKTEFAARFVHDYIKEGLQGEDIPGKSLSYETPEFGTLSEREVTLTLEHIFGAKTKKVNGIRMLSFDISKLQRLSRVYDLAIEIKVLRQGENSGSDRSDWTDVGMDRYTKPSTDKSEKKFEITVSERENSPVNSPADSPDPPEATHQTLKNDCNSVPLSSGSYKDLIEMKELSSTGRTVYRCKEHPESPEYYDLKGIEESHFKPVHDKPRT
jgi:hypothetical protein